MRRLDHSQFLDQAGRRHQRDICRESSTQPPVLIDRQMLGFEANPAQCKTLETVRQQREETARRHRSHQRESGGLCFHLQPVAAVPQDFRAVPGDHQVSQGPTEATEVAGILRSRDHQGVKLEIGQPPAHGSHAAC